MKQMEKKVNELIEESCLANDRGEFQLVSKKHLSLEENIFLCIFLAEQSFACEFTTFFVGLLVII